jgi:hypothetical protein
MQEDRSVDYRIRVLFRATSLSWPATKPGTNHQPCHLGTGNLDFAPELLLTRGCKVRLIGAEIPEKRPKPNEDPRNVAGCASAPSVSLQTA